MKQKRKVKSLLPYKIDRDGTMLTILLLILSLVLCLWSASLMTVSVWAADDRWNYEMVYPWIDDKVEVLYWLQISDRNRLWDEFVNQFFMKDKTLYLSPNQVKVKSKNSSFHDNTVDTWKYINVLWWENSKIKSDNITLIAWNRNIVEEWNDNASILWWEWNEIFGTSSWAPAVIAWWFGNKIQGYDSNVIIWWAQNIIENAENAVILWWETNTVNGRKNIIVWWSNVEVDGVDNVFVYSDSSTKFNPKSSNAFYLNLSDWVGINADAAKGWLSVSGAVGFGEIDINSETCNEDNIWVIWSWDGCLVWCTKASSSSSTWELLDRWSICEDKCEKNSKCMFTPTENSRTGADYTAFCTGAVSTEHADRCTTWENQSYENVVFETVIIDVNEECPVSGHNKCVYRCNPGTTLTWGECHQNCTLIWDDEVIVPHGYHVDAYNTTGAYCAVDKDSSNFPDTCDKHRHRIVCDDGEWLLAYDNWKPLPGQKKARDNGYINPSCMLEGYRCKTGTNYYNLKVSDIRDSLKDDTNTPKNQNNSRVAKDRSTVNGRRWQYKICIDYNANGKAPHEKYLNWDSCDTWSVIPQPPYHYKFIKCQEWYHTWVSHPNVCMQDCLLTGLNGIATGYKHGTSITGYMATGATCTGTCAAHKIVCNDGTWRLSKLTWGVTTEFPYNDCVLSDKVCTWYDLNQSIYNQHHSNSVYDACVPYSGNGKFTCNKQVTGYKLIDCISGNHTELEDESWMKWCISNEKVVNCQTGDKDLLKYEYIITWVKINWSGSWNTWYWSEPKVCEWKCGKDFHLSGDYFSGWVCVSNTWLAPCKTWWAEWHVKYIEEDVVISWSGSWNTGSWTEPGNCRLTWCEAGWCGPNCLYTGADIQCKERTNLRSWEVNIIESSFVACGDEPEPCKLKCIEGYHTGENWWCDPNIKREPCKQIDPTKLYDTSFMLEYLWKDWKWNLVNASGTECPIGDGTAMFETWSAFNSHLQKMGTILGKIAIVAFERADSIPSWITTEVISAPESELPIYAWYDEANGWTIYYYTQAKKIYLNPDSSRMFMSMEKLVNIDMSGWDASIATGMDMMFMDCKELTNLDLSSWDTSNVRTMMQMFTNCSNLARLNLGGKFNTSKVTDMRGMFLWCHSLVDFDLSQFDNFKTDNVTDMSNMFEGGPKLACTSLSKFNTSKVTDMTAMFSATPTENIDLSSFDTSNVTSMNSMFQWSNLESMDITSFTTSKVNNMDHMFARNSNLTTIYAEDFDIAKLSDRDKGECYSNRDHYDCKFNSMFKDDFALSTPYLDDPLQTCIELAGNVAWNQEHCYAAYHAHVSVVEYADYTDNGYFTKKDGKYYCKWRDGKDENAAYLIPWPEINQFMRELADWDLSKITAFTKSDDAPPAWTPTRTISEKLSWRTVIIWYDSWTIYYNIDTNTYNTEWKMYFNADSSQMFSWLYSLKSIWDNYWEDYSHWDTSNVEDMNSMFKDCESLDDIQFLEKWDTSNVTNMSSMFEGCRELSELDSLSGMNTSSVTNMSSMFKDCESLKGDENLLSLNNWNVSNVTNMSSMFQWCFSGLDNINFLSGWDTSSVTDMSSMFEWCSNLYDIESLARWDVSSVRDMSSMFEWSSLGDISPLNDWGDKTKNVTNMSSMFKSCGELKEVVDLGNWNTANVRDMSYMFAACDKLKEIDLGNWNTANVRDMSYMFWSVGDCSASNSIDVLNLPWNTANVTNMEGMFNNPNIKTLNLCTWDTSNVTDMKEMFKTDSTCGYRLTKILASDKFNTNKVSTSSDMFLNSLSLKWWNGTTYSSSFKDKTYARIDKAWQAWYFTACEGWTLTCPAPTITKVEWKDVYFDLNWADANSVNMQVSADKTSWTSNTFGPSNKLPILTSLDRWYVKLITRCKNGLSSDESNIAEFWRNYGRMVIDDIKNCMMSYHFEWWDDPLSWKTCCTDARLDHSDDGITWFPTTTTYSSPMKITSQGSEWMIYLKYRINGWDWSDVVSYNMPKQTGCYTKNAKKFYDETCLDWVPDWLYLPDWTLLTTISGWWWYSYKDNIEQFFNPIVHDWIHNYTPANWYFLGDTDINKVSGAIIEKSAYSDTVLVYAPCDSWQWCKFDLSWEAVPWNEYTEGWEKYTRFIRNLQRYSVWDLNWWCY